MRYRFTYCLMVLFIFIAAPSFAQQEITIQGKVTDSLDGTGIPGVSVLIKGTGKGTQTDANGNYNIKAPSNATLTFSFISYRRQEIAVNNQTTINVTLASESEVLDQVVVVGYGTQKRSQIVGSVSSVKSEEITKQPVLTAAQGLQGKASGVQINASGQPGSQPQVRIRGVGSVTGNQNPIYVVDGVITDDITNINNSDIESVEVLKDASAQAIYGSRAGNGVILVTTKSGKTGKMTVNVNSYAGFRSMTNGVDMSDGRSHAIYTNEAITNTNRLTGQNDPVIFDPNNLPTQTTDWMDAITRQGLVQNYDVSVSGGTEKTTYYFSGGYFGDQGILKGAKYDRVTARLNNEYKIAPYLSVGHNLTVTYNKNENKPTSAFSSAYRMAPSAPVRNADGSYGYLSALNVGNPVAAIDYTNDFSNSTRLQGNAYVNVRPIEGLTLRGDFNFDKTDGGGKIYVPVYSVFSAQQNNRSSLNVINQSRFYYIMNLQATYSKTFAEKHELNATAGYSFERDRANRSNLRVFDVPNQRNLWYLNQGDPSTLIVVEPKNNTANGGDLIRRVSYFGRMTYTYDNRYNISGSLRRDGSSSFPVNSKWGTFYSIGGSWNIANEHFMENQNLFDYLRLRVGYGQVGNDISIANNNLAVLQGVAQTGYYGFGYPNFPISLGQTYNKSRDALASWETTKGIDAGLEFGLLDSRLSGSFGYYNKLTEAYIPIRLPALAGDEDNTLYSQAAKVRNRGFEAALNWEERKSDDFSYRLGFNVTFNKNIVDEVTGNFQLRGGSLGNGEISTLSKVGEPIGSFWVYETDGFDENGNFRYRDVNGDGQLTESDRVFVGSYQPKTYFGFNAGVNYKQFDLSFDLYGNLGNKIFNGKRAVRFGNENIEQEVFEGRWTPNNTNASHPAPLNSIPRPSTYYIESGNFLRINNITLGYTFDNQKLTFLKDSKLRLFATAQNPFVFTSYSGYTPEIAEAASSNSPQGSIATSGSAINSGIELNVYPIYSTYMFGLNLTF
ncbi:SusC/RagA family TonB-linked outer membrane protein [Olivibacter jilunii]|uniref:SusC/RagA family TonB-linked outer membrane protein n=1 Tax=Olivibacter jilunii TaxID=985016 RepID=UPI003F15C93E